MILSAFSQKALKIIRTRLPGARLGVLVDRLNRYLRPFKTARALNAFSINPSAALASPRFVVNAHRQGLKVLVYGFRNDADLARCFDLRVDGLFVDDPEKAMAVFRAWKKRARDNTSR